MDKLKIIFSCGGTGGHIYPSIAIARAFQEIIPDVEILFVGASGKMEMIKVPQEGFDIKGITIAGFQRGLTLSNLFKNLLLPFKILYSLYSTFIILNKFKPNVVIGTGGYASGPTLKMASWLGIPTFIQEQNSIPGYTNKILGLSANGIFVSFEDSLKFFDKSKTHYTGNAIRKDFKEGIVSKVDASNYFGLDSSKKTVFITGGSLGADPINSAISSNIELLVKNDIQLIWQVGSRFYDKYSYLDSNSIKVLGFVDNINMAYSACDIVVSRAGGAVFEMFVVGKPMILLPSPNVAEDHQTRNAESIASSYACIMIKDINASKDLAKEIISLVNDKPRMDNMSKNISKLAKPNASSYIATYIINYLNERNG